MAASDDKVGLRGSQSVRLAYGSALSCRFLDLSISQMTGAKTKKSSAIGRSRKPVLVSPAATVTPAIPPRTIPRTPATRAILFQVLAS